MESLAHGFSRAVTHVFNLLLVPFGGSDVAGIIFISVLTGIALMFLFKKTTDQAGIKAARNRFKAHILEMRIYQDDLGLIFRALFAALWTNVSYLRVIWKAVVVLILLGGVVWVQLDERFGRTHLETGDATMLTVTLKQGLDPHSLNVTLEVPPGVELNSPPVRVGSERSVNWRLRAVAEGEHQLVIKVMDRQYDLPVYAAASTGLIGYTRTAGSTMDQLVHPGLPRMGRELPIHSVRLEYPSSAYSLFGWKTSWWLIFLIFISLGALIPKFIFRIEI